MSTNNPHQTYWGEVHTDSLYPGHRRLQLIAREKGSLVISYQDPLLVSLGQTTAQLT